MIELPEALILAKQAEESLKGKKIAHVFNATKLHRFTFFNGDPQEYGKLLTGKTILSTKGYGIFVDLFLSEGTILSIGDGVNMKYGKPGEKIPNNYQLLLGFKDNSFLVFTVSMYGFINVYPDGIIDNIYHKLSAESLSPLDEQYTETVFNKLFNEGDKNLSAKALLATKQRIPGIGNGVLQDILFNAGINPKRKISTLTDTQKTELYRSLKNTLQHMVAQGGRDTQNDLFGHKGGYKTILSAKNVQEPCPICKGKIIKETYLGGTIYYCPNCQP